MIVSHKRNIINNTEVRLFLDFLTNKIPVAKDYIHGPLRNYLYTISPMLDYSNQYKKFLTEEEQNVVKEKSKERFHVVVINKFILDEIIKTLDYIFSKYGEYKVSIPFHENNVKRKKENVVKRDLLKAIEGVTEVLYELGNGFKIVKLIDKQSFLREGFLMRHCIASHYLRDKGNHFSYRTNENKPLISIEVFQNKIAQAKGLANDEPYGTPNYINFRAVLTMKGIINFTNLHELESLLLQITDKKLKEDFFEFYTSQAVNYEKTDSPKESSNQRKSMIEIAQTLANIIRRI